MGKSNVISGKFRITHMDAWDQEYVDSEVPGFVRFEGQGRGEFQFGLVRGTMDCEHTRRDGLPAVEWSFEGNDEMDAVNGRGWAVLQPDGTLAGLIAIHDGDRSAFTAEPAGEKVKRKSGPKLRATDVTTGKTVLVDVGKLRPGPIRQPTLPDALLRRIRAIHNAVQGVYDQPLERMELNFMRDADPGREVALWERIVAGMAKAAVAMPKVDRKTILRTLLAYSMGALGKRELADRTVKQIIKIASEA